MGLFKNRSYYLKVEAQDAHADLGEEAGVGEEVVEQPKRGGVQAQLLQELAPGLGRVGNVRLALKLGKVLLSRLLERSVFCPKKIDHKSRLTLHPGYNLVHIADFDWVYKKIDLTSEKTFHL